MIKNISILKIFFIITLIMVGGVQVFAQTNVPAPLNEGSNSQHKEGGLRLGGAVANGTSLISGFRLDVLGQALVQGLNVLGVALFQQPSLSTTNGSLVTFSNTASGTNPSHIHYGPTGDWYIRSALPAGKVVMQEIGTSQFATGTSALVGIGMASPVTKLNVWGNVLLTGGDTINGLASNGLAYLNDTNSFIRATSTGLSLGVAGAPDAMVVNKAATNVLAGSVNIGGNSTTTPANYRLNANGTLHANTLTADSIETQTIQFSEISSLNGSYTPGFWNGFSNAISSSVFPACNASSRGVLLLVHLPVNIISYNERDVFAFCRAFLDPSAGYLYEWDLLNQ